MAWQEENSAKIEVVTLGPTGTCHERAVIAYMGFQGVEDFEIGFIGDFFDGLEKIRGRENAFLVQCSAHPLVHKITERYWSEVFVVDNGSADGSPAMVRAEFSNVTLLENSDALAAAAATLAASFEHRGWTVTVAGRIPRFKPSKELRQAVR